MQSLKVLVLESLPLEVFAPAGANTLECIQDNPTISHYGTKSRSLIYFQNAENESPLHLLGAVQPIYAALAESCTTAHRLIYHTPQPTNPPHFTRSNFSNLRSTADLHIHNLYLHQKTLRRDAGIHSSTNPIFHITEHTPLMGMAPRLRHHSRPYCNRQDSPSDP